MKPRSIDKNYNAIEKCLQILSMYSLDKTQFSIKEICTQLNFNVSTAYRILCTLEEYGYVSRLKNKDYVIGTQALYLSAIYTQSNHLEQIRPIVDRIRDISGETSSFFVEEDDNRICLYRAHSRDEIRHNIELEKINVLTKHYNTKIAEFCRHHGIYESTVVGTSCYNSYAVYHSLCK